MAFADLPGLRMHYELEGPAGAPVLVLSNSLGTSTALWDAQRDVLARHWQVLRYDQRGHGATAAPGGDYTLAVLGGDVVALLAHLGIARAHFCGISMGGLTGLWLGVHAPQCIDRLVLANTAAQIGTASAWNARIDAVATSGLPTMAAALLARWFTPAYLAADAPPLPALRAALAQMSPVGYAGCCAAVRDADLRGVVASIQAPTLVIAGTYDVSTTPADAHFLAANVADARYVELPVAHISNVEAAAAFNAAVAAFLAA